MKYTIADGVWPTMITPFTDNNDIDYDVVEKIIEWYIERGVNGIFSVCQSSEMFYMSLRERLELAGFVKKCSRERVQVIASGHISNSLKDQTEEIKAMADTGIDAVVIITNRLAGENETDDVWKRNAEKILNAVDKVTLGLYECPFPYKRLMSPDILKWCASTDRFVFLKDTCCNTQQIKDKIDAVKGAGLKLFNANAATLLESLQLGAAGYSGVMCNFHPELYVWIMENWRDKLDEAKNLQNFLGLSSIIECQYYPVNAKYFLALDGLDVKLNTRSKNPALFTMSNRLEVEQFYRISKQFSSRH